MIRVSLHGGTNWVDAYRANTSAPEWAVVSRLEIPEVARRDLAGSYPHLSALRVKAAKWGFSVRAFSRRFEHAADFR